MIVFGVCVLCDMALVWTAVHPPETVWRDALIDMGLLVFPVLLILFVVYLNKMKNDSREAMRDAVSRKVFSKIAKERIAAEAGKTAAGNAGRESGGGSENLARRDPADYGECPVISALFSLPRGIDLSEALNIALGDFRSQAEAFVGLRENGASRSLMRIERGRTGSCTSCASRPRRRRGAR